MSHRKFEHPRCGSLGFLPKKRCKRHQPKVRSWPKDDRSKAPHLCAFYALKVGMTHVMRAMDRPGSILNKREVVEPVTILEAPSMVCIGFVAYNETPKGLAPVSTVWSKTLSEGALRRFYKDFNRSKKMAFCNYKSLPEADYEARVNKAIKYGTVIRALMQTQPEEVKALKRRKANIMEVQVNGGSIADKVEYIKNIMETKVPADQVFQELETIDICAITKGHGYKGVISRWGVTRLPRKTHRGLRKVACIGAWHPARVQFQIARAGQKGHHHRTEFNKRIYRLGASVDSNTENAATNAEITEKSINPMGGWKRYGLIRHQYFMIKGMVAGPVRTGVLLRKGLGVPRNRRHHEPIDLKFIDTASRCGKSRFQTSEEKAQYFGRV